MPTRSRAEVDPIARAFGVLRRRLLARALLARAPATLAASTAILLLGAALVGPSPSVPLLVATVLAAFAPFPIAGASASRELVPFAGLAAARTLGATHPWLASALRSAAEFGRSDAESNGLSRAHRDAVVDALARVDLRRTVDLARVARRASVALLGSSLVFGIVSTNDARVEAGLYALAHPMNERHGERLALVVRDLTLTVTPPRHRTGSSVTRHRNPSRLEVDEGARVTIETNLELDAITVDVALGGTSVELRRVTSRTFRGEAVARRSGPLSIRARADRARLVDAARRVLVVRDDQAPTLRVVRASPESPIGADATIAVEVEANDDVGLVELTRVVRGPSGVETRTVLGAPSSPTRHLASSTELDASEFDLRPGDAITVLFEAKDNDSVDGPKTARSEPLTFVVDDGREARDRATADLRGLLDESVDVLAARLETEIPTDPATLLARNRRLAEGVRALANRLRAVAETPADELGLAAPDRGLLRGLERRLGTVATNDEASGSRGTSAVERTDAAAVDVLESAVLSLADLLGRVELEDAAAIAREIASLQRELATLVRELREHPSESLRNAVRTTMERIRRRMGELSSRLGSMKDELPSEFRNAASAASAEAGDALGDLERALSNDDLDAAERAVTELERALRGMTQSSSDASDEFSSSRFGPRQRAFADAFQRLSELEVEQTTLAHDSARVRDGLSQRATDALGDERVSGLAPLAAEARRIAETLRQLDRIDGAPVDDASLGNARARLDDAREALSRGDLGEARAMLDRTTGAVEAIASDLDLSRRMFDGIDGRVARASEIANDAASAIRTLDDRVSRALPTLESQMHRADQDSLASNATRQLRAREATGELAEAFGDDSQGAPIAPEVAQGLREAQSMMSEAETSLSRRDAIGAANTQARAARRLRELREEIERQASSSGGGGSEGGEGGGGGGSGGSSATAGDRVDVPNPSTSEDAATRRRRVLDAMGTDVPEAYRGSVRRYYEELLR